MYYLALTFTSAHNDNKDDNDTSIGKGLGEATVRIVTIKRIVRGVVREDTIAVTAMATMMTTTRWSDKRCGCIEPRP